RVHVRKVRTGNRQPYRIGAGGQEQRVVGVGPAIFKQNTFVIGLDGCDARAERQLDLMLCVELRRAKRNPVLGRATGQIILRQVGAIVRNGWIGADQEQRTGITLSPKHLGRGISRRSSASDHHPAGELPGKLRPRLGCGLSRYKYFLVLLFDIETIYRIERRRAYRLANPQAKAGVMPWASHRVVDYEPFRPRPAVMGALRPNGKQLTACSRNEHRLALKVTLNHLTIFHGSRGDPLRQVRAGRLSRLRSHVFSLLEGATPKAGGDQ